MSTIWDEIDRTIGRPSAAPRRTSVWDDIDRELARDEAADAERAQAGAPRPTLPSGPTLAELVSRRSAPPPPRETWDAPPPQMDLAGVATPTSEGARAAREMAAEVFGVARRAVTNVPRAIAAGVPRLNQGFWGGVQAIGESTGLEPVADFGRRAGAQAAQLATDIAGPQEGAGWAERAAYGGLQSVVPSVAALAAGAVTGNPAVALGAMGAMTGGTSYAEAREAGVPVPQALVYGASQGAVEAATERLPVGQLLGDLAQRTGLFRTVLHQIATEVPTEQAATVLQDLNEWATLTPERPLGDYLRERPSAAAETLVATIAATALQTGAMHLGARLAERGSGPPPGRPTPPSEAPASPPPVDEAQVAHAVEMQRQSQEAARRAAAQRAQQQAAFARYAAADAAAQQAPDTVPSAPPVDAAAVQRAVLASQDARRASRFDEFAQADPADTLAPAAAEEAQARVAAIERAQAEAKARRRAARGTRLPGVSLAEQLGELVVPEVRYADDPLTLAEREQVAAVGGDPLLAYGEVAAEMGWPEPVAGRRMDAPETPPAAPPLRREPAATVEPGQGEAAQAPTVPRETPRLVAEIDATLAEGGEGRAEAPPARPARLFAVQGRQRYPVASLQDAQAKWNAARDAYAEASGAGGVSEIGNGVVVVDEADQVVGRISYNGRIWDADGREVRSQPQTVTAQSPQPVAAEAPAPPRAEAADRAPSTPTAPPVVARDAAHARNVIAQALKVIKANTDRQGATRSNQRGVVDGAYDRLKWTLHDLRRQGDLDATTIDRVVKSGVYDARALAEYLPEANAAAPVAPAPSTPAAPATPPATTPPGPPAAASRFVARPADAPGWYRVVDTQTGETVVTTKGRQAAVGEARRRNGRPAKAAKGPKVDPFDAIEAAARERGYYGPREGLERAYRDFQSANEAMSEAAGDAAGEGVALLRAIAQAGGLGPDAAFQGEIDDLWEASTGTYVPSLTRTRTGRVPKARRFPKGGLLGVSGVLVRSGGLPVDRVREAVADLPQFRHFADAKGAEFLDAVREAVARGRQELPTPTGQWWQPFVGDDGVAPEHREPDFLNEHELTAEGIAEVFGYSKAQAADLLKIAQAYFTDEQLEQLTLFKGGTPGERGESYRQGPKRAKGRDQTARIRTLLNQADASDQDVRGSGRINNDRADRAVDALKRLTHAEVAAASGLTDAERADVYQLIGPPSASDYRGSHRPSGADSGAPLHDLTGDGRIYPSDVYGADGERIYAAGTPQQNREAFAIARRLKGKPDAEVTVYRAVPKGVAQTALRPGDWVAITRGYAEDHGARWDEGATIIAQKVRAREIFTSGDSIQEWGYWPQSQPANILFQSPTDGATADTWYFHPLSRAVAAWQPRGTAEQLRAHLAKTKGATDEARDMGLLDWLAGREKVTRAEVDAYLQQHTVVLEETVLADEGETARAARDRIQAAGYDIAVTDMDTDDGQEVYLTRLDEEGFAEEVDLADAPTEVQAAFRQYQAKASPPQYQRYTIPGGENYREILLRMPTRTTEITDPPRRTPVEVRGPTPGSGQFFLVDAQGEWVGTDERPTYYATRADAEAALDWLRVTPATRTVVDAANNYTAPHFSAYPNILTHIRVNERTLVDGRRVLFIEEIQSDWHQTGRRQGYASEVAELERQHAAKIEEIYARENELPRGTRDDAEVFRLTDEANEIFDRLQSLKEQVVPDAPFKGDLWKKLALKRMLAYAAEQGMDGIAWTTGAQQVDRYENELRQNVDEIRWTRQGYHAYLVVTAFKGNRVRFEGTASRNDAGAWVFKRGPAAGKTVEDVLGKEITKQIAERQEGSARGDSLTVGGAGMTGFYDRELVNLANDLAKPWKQRVEPAYMTGPNTQGIANDNAQHAAAIGAAPVHFLATPAPMRDDIRQRRLALYQTLNRASVEFFDNMSRALIRALSRPDASSFLHELGHVIHAWLLNRDIPADLREGVTDEMIDKIERFLGVEAGTPWIAIPMPAKERFAQAFVTFVNEGKAPTPALRPVFSRIAAWLKKLWAALGTTETIEITDEVREVFTQLAQNVERLRLARTGPPPGRPQATVAPDAPRGPPTTRRDDDIALPGLAAVRGRALGETGPRLTTVDALAPDDGAFALAAENEPPPDSRAAREAAGQGTMFERGGGDRERAARETPAEPAPGHVPATPRTTLTTREAFDRWLPDATPPPTPQSEGQTIGLLRTIFGEAIPPSPWDRLRGRASGGVVPIPVGYRRFRERALGLYKRHEHAIRLKSWGDLNTFVHELGHALDTRLLGDGKPESFMNVEILALGRETSDANAEQDVLRAEGVANFYRAYFRDPAWARTLAPTYAAELEAYLATQPVVAQQLEDGVGVVRAYLAQDEATRGAARIDFTGETPASPRTFWQRTWDAWFDEHTPLKRIEQKLTSDPLNITASPYWLRRLASGMDAKASAFLEGQVRGVDGRILGPGLKTVLAPIDAKDRQTFSRYLVARHAVHHYVQGLRAAGQVDQAIRLEREYGLPSTILPEGYVWKFKDPGLSFKEAAALLKRTRTDTFDEVAEGLAGFRRAVMAYLVERGAVSHATQALLEELYGAYVPLYRVMDRDDDGAGAGGRTEIASLGSPIKTRKGSRRDIIDPLETTIRNTVAMVRMAERNAVWQALVTLAEKTPTGAKILERIPDPVQAQQVNLLALKRSIAQAFGDHFDFDLATETKDLIAQRVEAVKEEFEDDEALRSDEGRKALKAARKDPLDVLALYFAPVPLSARGHDVERVIIDGQPIFHEIHDRELLEYLAGLDAQSASRLVSLADAVLAPFTRIKRAGITLAPDFGARNIARDAVMAFLNSDYGFKPGVDSLRGLRDFVAQGENYWLWRAGGGEMAVFAGQDREEVRQYLREVFDLEHVKTPQQFLAAYARAFKDATTRWEQAKTLGKLADASLLQPLRVLSGAMEAATRLGEFRRALESEGYHDAAVRKTKGISKSEAYARAIRASREVSLDFQSGGSKARQWNRSQAFFNATLLGVRRLGEVGTRHPARSLRRLAVMSVMPAVATVVLRALLDRDDEWEELDPGVRKTYWHIPAPWGWIRYPKAFDVDDLIGSRVEAILHAAIKQDRSVLKDVMPGGLEEALRWMAQRVIPDAILPALEVAANYHFFRDREIVPSWREGLDRELQASRYTSEVAKALGPRLGLAPDEFDHLFYGYTGGLGRHVLSGASTVMAATGATAGPPAPRPARGVNGLPVVGVFVRRGGAGLQAQSIADLFKEADQWTGKTRSRAEYRRAGQAAKVAEVDAWMAEHGGETRRKAVAQAVEALREERTLINAIYRAPGTVLTADEKAVLLDLVEARMGQAARRAMGRTPLKTPPADPAVLALERKVKAWKPETGIPAKPPR